MDIAAQIQGRNEVQSVTPIDDPSKLTYTPILLRNLLEPYNYQHRNSTLFEKISDLVKDIFIVVGFIALFTVNIAALGIPGFIMYQLSNKLDRLKADLDRVNQLDDERPTYIVYKREGNQNRIKETSNERYIPRHGEVKDTHYIEYIVPKYVVDWERERKGMIKAWINIQERLPEGGEIRWTPKMPTQSEARIERIWKHFNS